MAKDTLLELRAQFKDSWNKLLKFATEAKKDKYTNLELKDGTMITTTDTDLKVGSEVFILDEAGNQTAIDDKTYELKDGRTFTTVKGKVTEVKEIENTDKVETPAEGSAAGMKKEEMTDNGLPEGQADPNIDGTDIESRVTAIENQLADIVNMLNDIISSSNTQNEVNEKMDKKFSEIKQLIDETPGDQPIKPAKKGYEEYDSKRVKDQVRMESIMEMRKRVQDKSDAKMGKFIG